MKIGVVGTGMVGSASAYAMVLRGVGSEIILVDANPKRAAAEAQDILHATPFAHPTKVRSGPYSELAGSAVVVLACGVSQRPGETRLDLLARNAEVFGEVIPCVLEVAPQAIFIVATNPVDIMTQVAQELSGLAPSRVIGTGTLLDTARFRSLLGTHLGISPKSIHAYVLGEHGDSEVLCWSGAHAGGVPILELGNQLAKPIDDEVRAEIEDGVRGAAYRIIDGKGATWYGIGAGVSRLVRAILNSEQTLLTVSTVSDRFKDLGEVAFSLPHSVGAEGAVAPVSLELSKDEQEHLHASAEILATAWQEIKGRVSGARGG